MNELLSRIFSAPIHPARAWLLERLLLLVLAVDIWTANLASAGRYDSGGFHVAHFPFLDALLPTPSIPLYVALHVAAGVLCIVALVQRTLPRLLLALIAVFYTWGWAMSVLDSYQHHYLMSLLLVTLAIAPRPASSFRTERQPDDPEPQTEGESAEDEGTRKCAETADTQPRRDLVALGANPAYTALMWTIALVYLYTGIAKFEPAWLSGEALQRVLLLPPGGEPLPGGEDRAAFFRTLLTPLGLRGQQLWWTLGHGVVLTQWVIAAGYFLAPLREVRWARFGHFVYPLAMFSALLFHIGAEQMQLKIGWFSWYMIGAALVVFTPVAVLARLQRCAEPPLPGRLNAGRNVVPIVVLAAAAGLFYALKLDGFLWLSVAVLTLIVVVRFGELVRRLEARRPAFRWLALPAAAVLLLVGFVADIPGALPGVLCGLACAGAYLYVHKGKPGGVSYAQSAWALLVAAVLFSTALDALDVRWDFYRYYGGDLARRGELSEALEVYEQANRYAPEGENRDEAIERVQRRLEQGR